jgi:hypothetical protein
VSGRFLQWLQDYTEINLKAQYTPDVPLIYSPRLSDPLYTAQIRVWNCVANQAPNCVGIVRYANGVTAFGDVKCG